MTEEEFLTELREIAKCYTIKYRKYLQAVADFCGRHDVYTMNYMELALMTATKEEEQE